MSASNLNSFKLDYLIIFVISQIVLFLITISKITE